MKDKKLDNWIEKKKYADKKEHIPYFNEAEIWWAQLGENIASESNGKGNDFLRPVLVLKKLYGTSAFVIPLTTQEKIGSYYLEFKDKTGRVQRGILAQAKYIDGRRFIRQLSSVDKSTMNEIRQKFIELIQS